MSVGINRPNEETKVFLTSAIAGVSLPSAGFVHIRAVLATSRFTKPLSSNQLMEFSKVCLKIGILWQSMKYCLLFNTN